jgi:hypothetical protein
VLVEYRWAEGDYAPDCNACAGRPNVRLP